MKTAVIEFDDAGNVIVNEQGNWFEVFPCKDGYTADDMNRLYTRLDIMLPDVKFESRVGLQPNELWSPYDR